MAQRKEDYVTPEVQKTDEEWRQQLTPMQFKVTRKHGTEPAFQNEYWDNKRTGQYRCICCGAELFHSDHKYNSGTGWPSFYQPMGDAPLREVEDSSWFQTRTEVRCRRCESHLGHVFPDGPHPTGMRYCMNSAALRFVEDQPAENAEDASEPHDAE